MSEPPKEPLEYQTPEKSSRTREGVGAGCLAVAVLIAGGVALLGVMVVGMAWDNNNFGQAIVCIVIPAALTGIALYLRRKMNGLMNIAVAITLIAAATFLLLFGVCANNFRI